MVETKTPGQLCYEAYLRHWNIPGLRTWHEEPRGQQRAWETAAQAVLTRKETTMSEPLAPIALYARLLDASFSLKREIDRLSDAANTLFLDAAWVHLDDLIEQLPAALAWDAEQRQEEEHDDV